MKDLLTQRFKITGYDRTHWEAAKWVLNYLKATSDVDIAYTRDKNCDAEWAGNRVDRKSISAYVFTRCVAPRQVIQCESFCANRVMLCCASHTSRVVPVRAVLLVCKLCGLLCLDRVMPGCAARVMPYSGNGSDDGRAIFQQAGNAIRCEPTWHVSTLPRSRIESTWLN
jgi:hypothetical protein